MIAIINYGVGNLESVLNALRYLNIDAIITDKKDEILKADKIILPGVGAFGDAINAFRNLGFEEVINEAIKKNIPILGICVGMQMMFENSYEFGHHKGLGIFKGDVIKFENDELKIPQIGWNNINIKKESKLLKGISNNSYFYFVHSYHISNADNKDITATTNYGIEYASIVEKDNIYACQFHPEKSGELGLKILKNFGDL